MFVTSATAFDMSFKLRFEFKSLLTFSAAQFVSVITVMLFHMCISFKYTKIYDHMSLTFDLILKKE